MNPAVPASVRALIRERVQAYEQLEILLLLHGAPGRGWSAEELSAELNLQSVMVEAALAHLQQHGFVELEAARYRYRPAEMRLQVTVDELARSYEDSRAELLALIASDAMGRVRRRMRQLRERLS